MKNESETCPKCGAVIPENAPQGLCPKCLMGEAATSTESGVAGSQKLDIPPLEAIIAAFPELENIEMIGRGGMGFVYKARQPKLARNVALKILPESLARNPAFAERFHREARMLAQLNHPCIVTLFDFGQADQFFYLLMEFVDGVNLRQALRLGRFSPKQALDIVPKICEALQYAHDEGILHRDIKPENILLDAKGRVKIADFGIARIAGDVTAESGLTASGIVLGTPHYMAPEQIEKPSDVDHRADIYSLGVVFYEMLTGELPIGRFEVPSSKTPVNAQIDEVVLRTLEKEREKRYQSAGEVKTNVEEIAASATGAKTVIDQAQGSGETSHDPSKPSGAVSGKISRKAIASAISGGLSLVSFVPYSVVLISLLMSATGDARGSGLPWAVAILVGGLSGLVFGFGLGGTVVGLVSLHEIRNSGGRLAGGGMAMFGVLALPLAVVNLALLYPYLISPTTGRLAVVLGAMILITGLAIVAGVSWLRRLPSPLFTRHTTDTHTAHSNPWPRRLFWLIVVLVTIPIVLIGVMLIVPMLAYRSADASKPVLERTVGQKPVTQESGQLADGVSSKLVSSMPLIEASFQVPAGYAATVLPIYRSNSVVAPLPNLAMFIIASGQEPTPGNYFLIQETNSTDGRENISWMSQMASQGSSSSSHVSNLPESFPTLIDSGPVTLEVEPGGEISVWLESIDGEQLDVGLVIRTDRTSIAAKAGVDSSVVGNGTNWVEYLKRD